MNYERQEDKLNKAIEIINKRIQKLENDKFSIMQDLYKREFKISEYFIEKSKEEIYIEDILEKYVEVIEHKIEEYSGGIGGPQHKQVRYKYTLEEKNGDLK